MSLPTVVTDPTGRRRIGTAETLLGSGARMARIGIAWLGWSVLAAAACGPRTGQALALVGATVIDANGIETHDAFVVVRDGRIDAMGPQRLVSLPKDAEIVDLRGRFVVPLVDPQQVRQAFAGVGGARGAVALGAALRAAGASPQALFPGSPADLLVLTSDPRTDPANLSAVAGRFRQGLWEEPRTPGS